MRILHWLYGKKKKEAQERRAWQRKMHPPVHKYFLHWKRCGTFVKKWRDGLAEDEKMKKFHAGVRCAVLSALLVSEIFPGIAFAEATSCPGIHVKILNIRNSTGTIDCAIFDSPVGFPKEVLRSATQAMIIKIRNKEALCTFEDIPPGTYALAVIHDENMNGELDTYWLGIPREGYGFSNDARAKMGTPSFSAACFQYDGGTLDLTISLHY